MHPLVRPLEARFQDVLDVVLRGMARPPLSTRDVARLAPKVAELSRAYNAGLAEGGRTKLPLEARVAFSFPRDVPKGAGAVRELVATGALAIPQDRPLRVLDLGAGLGAMTWGLVRALAASGAAGTVEALLVDEDAEALRAAEAIARAERAVAGGGDVALSVTTRTASLGAAGGEGAARGRPGLFGPTGVLRGRYDVVLLGQVLSELDPSGAPEERLAEHAALVRDLLEHALAEDGALVLVEPALRGRTRHLHALRDRLLAEGAAKGPAVTVFAPCLHALACPALAGETDWCHEDLPVDLPEWVTPLAREAGLRWQGITFSYLVLRKDGRTVAAPTAAAPDRVRLRVVSDVLRTKGKTELFVCGESGARAKIRRLDRDAAAEPSGAAPLARPFGDLRRGDVVTLSTATVPGAEPRAPIDARGRVAADALATIDVVPRPR